MSSACTSLERRTWTLGAAYLSDGSCRMVVQSNASYMIIHQMRTTTLPSQTVFRVLQVPPTHDGAFCSQGFVKMSQKAASALSEQTFGLGPRRRMLGTQFLNRRKTRSDCRVLCYPSAVFRPQRRQSPVKVSLRDSLSVLDRGFATRIGIW